jgi:FkbM family methyltransferase
MSRNIPPVTNININGAILQNLIGVDATTILEIGAHHGWHSVGLLQTFPRATVHSFEPDPRAFAVHTRMVNNPRSKLYQLAIGATNGDANFHTSGGLPPGLDATLKAHYPEGWDQSGSLRTPKGHIQKYPWCEFKRTISVEVRTLDNWASKHAPGDIDFIWADMQGAEGDLATDGAQTLARTRFLYCEYNNEELYEGEPSLTRLLELLPTFDVVYRLPGDVLLRNTALVRTSERNLLSARGLSSVLRNGEKDGLSTWTT